MQRSNCINKLYQILSLLRIQAHLTLTVVKWNSFLWFGPSKSAIVFKKKHTHTGAIMKTVCVQDNWLPQSSSMVEYWEGVVLEVYLLLYIFIIVLNMLVKMENLN